MALASSIGVPFAVLVSFGALAGLKLDKKLGTTPWLLLIGVGLGAVAAFMNLVRVVARFQRLDTSSDDGTVGQGDGETRGRT